MPDIKKTPVTNPPKNGDKPANMPSDSSNVPLGSGLAEQAKQKLKNRGKELEDQLDSYTK